MHPLESLTIPPGHVGIHWFGQSSYAVKDSDGTIVLFDPYFPHERPSDIPSFIRSRHWMSPNWLPRT